MRVASSSTCIKFHNWPSGDIVDTYVPQSRSDGPVRTLSWNKDGTWVISVSCGMIPEVISVAKGQPKQLVAIRDHVSTCAAFQNTTKRSIILGTTSNQVIIQIYHFLHWIFVSFRKIFL